MKALRFDNDTIKAVARLSNCTCVSTAMATPGWTDSAVRRYVTDAGPLLERLHRLTRSDVTTRNQRKADRFSFAYDDLEQRITSLPSRNRLAAIRPDLDGAQIMALLGLKPGPVVGRAYKFLLEERMENGPLTRTKPSRKLLAWWAAQPESAVVEPFIGTELSTHAKAGTARTRGVLMNPAPPHHAHSSGSCATARPNGPRAANTPA